MPFFASITSTQVVKDDWEISLRPAGTDPSETEQLQKYFQLLEISNLIYMITIVELFFRRAFE